MDSKRDYGSNSTSSSTVRYNTMDFSRLSQNVGQNIQKMSSQVSDVERMVRQIGTGADSTDLRDRLHSLTHTIHNMARDTGAMLKDMAALPQSSVQQEQRQQKLMKERLVEQFTDALQRFQNAQNQAAKKERESIVRARAQSGGQTGTGAPGQWNPFEDDSQKQFGQQSAPAPTQTSVQIEQDVDLQELRERQDAIRRLESDISDVNQIFKDLAVMVHEQGEMIDNIETHVESAQVSVQHATTELGTARKYQSKARRKMVCIIGLLLAVALILFLIIYFNVPH